MNESRTGTRSEDACMGTALRIQLASEVRSAPPGSSTPSGLGVEEARWGNTLPASAVRRPVSNRRLPRTLRARMPRACGAFVRSTHIKVDTATASAMMRKTHETRCVITHTRTRSGDNNENEGPFHGGLVRALDFSRRGPAGALGCAGWHARFDVFSLTEYGVFDTFQPIADVVVGESKQLYWRLRLTTAVPKRRTRSGG